MHIILHALSLLVVVQCVTVMYINYHRSKQSRVKGCWAPPKKIQRGPFNISKRLGSCVLFRASYKLAPWAALFQNLTKLNQ